MNHILHAAPRIVVVGGVNTDLTARVVHFPLPGETIPGHDLAIVGGGKGANSAVAAARMGGRVALVACIGDDPFGSARHAELAAEGLDLTGLATAPGTATGVALIAVDAGGQNTIVVVPGANAVLRPRHLAGLPLETGDLLLTQLESPLETVEAALRLGVERGATTLLNYAPYHTEAHALLPLADVIVVNEHEAAGLLGVPSLLPADALDAAVALLARGPRAAVLTLGAAGVAAANASGAGRIPAPSVMVRDTTAAGDAFTGALAAGLAAGAEFFAAAGVAVLASALAVTKAGAQPSLPTRAEVERFRRALENATTSAL